MPKRRNNSHQPEVEKNAQNSMPEGQQADMPQDSGYNDASDESDARRKGSDANRSNADKQAGNASNAENPNAGMNGDVSDGDNDVPSGENGVGKHPGMENDSGNGSNVHNPLSNANKGVSPVGDPMSGNPTGSGSPVNGAGKAIGKSLKGFGNGVKTAIGGGAIGIGNSILHGASGVGQGVTRAATKVATVVGNTLGIPRMVAGLLVGTLMAGTLAGGGMMIANYQYEQHMMTQEMIVEDDCAENVDAALATTPTVTGDDDAMMRENAAKAWAVLKALGLTDEQAAGAVGNMQGEGGLSPYTMECDFITAPNEKWTIGPKKQGFIADLNSWTLNWVFPYYHISLNYAFYGTSRHGFVAGVGLCGFTGCNYDDLEDWAAGLGTTWYDEEKAFDVQMSFIIAPSANGGYGGPGGASDWLREWGNNTSGCGSPSAAADVFCRKFEGIACADQKKQYAEHWFTEFKGTMGDTAYANSILQMASVTMAGSAGNAANDEAEDCGLEETKFDNSDLARAAVAYAYKTKDEGRGNDGTELYRKLHEIIFPGDPYFQSCDRGVATAVRWSDADDNFPAGPCTSILSHCNSDTDHWEYVGKGVQVQDAGELQPGDVCVCTGHVVIYVGHELIAEKFPDADPNADFVSASLNERSPGCGHEDFHYDTRDYYVFRLKHYDEPGMYKNVVEGQTLNDR